MGMADIAIQVDVSGEPQPFAMSLLAQDLTAGAGARLRPAAGWSPDGSKTTSGMSVTELVVTGALSATTLRAVSAVLVAWVQVRSKRKLTLKSGDDQLVIDGTVTEAQQALVEKWMGDRAG